MSVSVCVLERQRMHESVCSYRGFATKFMKDFCNTSFKATCTQENTVNIKKIKLSHFLLFGPLTTETDMLTHKISMYSDLYEKRVKAVPEWSFEVSVY